jgi:hypothetical protein
MVSRSTWYVAGLALAVGSCVLAAEPAAKLILNGQAASTEVKMIDGRYYVPVDDLAKALGATTTITLKPGAGAEIALALPTSPKAPDKQPGSIGGVITYYFNANFGDKPDTGAKLQLVQGDVMIPKTSFLLLDTVIKPGKNGAKDEETELKVVSEGTADGSGRYELKDVPAGQYTLIITSSHRKDASLRDVSGQVICLPVLIKAGMTQNQSWNFGLENIQ